MEKTNKESREVSIGTAYEVNKNLVSKYEKKLTPQKIRIAKEKMANYIETTNNQYYMLLCHERRDYTIFNLKETKGYTAAAGEAVEIAVSRGEVRGIDYLKDTNAFEIWIMIDDEAFAYYFFPCDPLIVEIEGDAE